MPYWSACSSLALSAGSFSPLSPAGMSKTSAALTGKAQPASLPFSTGSQMAEDQATYDLPAHLVHYTAGSTACTHACMEV